MASEPAPTPCACGPSWNYYCRLHGRQALIELLTKATKALDEIRELPTVAKYWGPQVEDMIHGYVATGGPWDIAAAFLRDNAASIEQLGVAP